MRKLILTALSFMISASAALAVVVVPQPSGGGGSGTVVGANGISASTSGSTTTVKLETPEFTVSGAGELTISPMSTETHFGVGGGGGGPTITPLTLNMPTGDTHVGCVINATTNTGVHLQDWNGNSGSAGSSMYITDNGLLAVSGGITTNGNVVVQPASTSVVPLLINPNSSTSVDLFEINVGGGSSGNALKVDHTGALTVNGATNISTSNNLAPLTLRANGTGTGQSSLVVSGPPPGDGNIADFNTTYGGNVQVDGAGYINSYGSLIWNNSFSAVYGATFSNNSGNSIQIYDPSFSNILDNFDYQGGLHIQPLNGVGITATGDSASSDILELNKNGGTGGNAFKIDSTGTVTVSGNFAVNQSSSFEGFGDSVICYNNELLGGSIRSNAGGTSGTSGNPWSNTYTNALTCGGNIYRSGSGAYFDQSTPTSVAGTAGSYEWWQPFQGTALKEVDIQLSGYTNASTSTITFTTAFTNTPQIIFNGTGISPTGLSSSGVTIPISTSQTGVIIIKGF